MEKGEYANLEEWLRRSSKEQLETLFEAGEVPVVGWLKLPTIINTASERKKQLKAELEKNASERVILAEQMRIHCEKQEKLDNKKQQLQEEMEKLDEIATLEAVSDSIAMLAEKEKACVAQLEKKMENPYFMDHLDSQDVSTVFSLFNMDSLLPRYKQNDIDNNLAVTVTTAVEHLQNDLELTFSEAVELLWKLKLFKHGEKGVARHLAKCSICSSTKPGLLLQEYGLEQAERKEIEEKMKEWKGYYFVSAKARPAAVELNLAREIRRKFTTCWVRIQKAHKWEHQEDSQ